MEQFFRRIICLLCCGQLLDATRIGPSYAWTHQLKLPGSGDFQVKWINTDPEWVTIEIRGKTQGYLGIGFSPKGGMRGADIVIGWVDDSGLAHLKDYHGVTNGMPIEDAQQDYHLIFGQELEDETVLVFRRKWDTCDEHDIPIGDDTLRLIWAWHPDDPVDGALHHHGLGDRRGVRSLYMRTASKPQLFPDEDPTDTTTKHWDIQMHNFPIPLSPSRYYCRIHKFPKLNKKHHIIGYKPLIAPESAPYVHHINVMNCHVPEVLGKTADIFAKYLDHEGGDCFTHETPTEWKEFCVAMRVAVAVGAEGDIYAEHIGDPIGNDAGDETYLRLEMHYENPYLHNILDSSGIRIYYTEKLRQYDAAVLFAGYRRTPFLSIPPYQTQFRMYGYCGSECTKMGFPPTGIKVFSILIHAHLKARKLLLRHVRNGVELTPLASENHYDFNYQEYRKLSPEVTVLPGDELIMECEYDTSRNNTFIFGGLSTQEEMCEAFIYYYPKSTLTDCRSQPEFYSYLNAMGGVNNATGSILRRLNLPFDPALLSDQQRALALADDVYVLKYIQEHDVFSGLQITSPKNISGQTMMDYITSLNWRNKEFAKTVQEKLRTAPRYLHCSGEHGDRIQIRNHIVKIGNYKKRLPSQSLCNSGNLLTSMLTWVSIVFLVRY